MMNQGAQSRFADYFVICGLDVSSGLEPDQLSGESLHCPPLDRPYKSKVLANYPNNVPWNPFDKDAIGLLCLPRGLSFRTQRDCRKPKYHSFIITREDGTRTNGAAFVFYEEMDNKQICAAMQTLQHMYQAELSTASSYTTDPDHHNRTRTVAKPETKIKTFDANRDKLYVTKCIGLVMPLLFVSSARNLLKQLYEAMIRPSLLSLESFVYNILYEVPLPPPGRSMKLYGSQSAIFCQRPGLNELPLFDFNLWELFRILNPEKLMLVFTSVLLEHQILLYSSDYQKLMLCAEAISILVFPFSWQHVYVPILPASLQHFLDAPVPYIMGLHHGSEDRSQLSLPSEANMCFVNIDDSDVEVPEDLPSFPHKHDVLEELQSCIDSYRASKASEIRQQVAPPNTPAHTFSNKNNNSQVEDEDKWTNKMEILQQSEAWTKISALAKKAGVHHTVIDDLQDSPTKQRKELDCKDPTSIPEKDLLDLKFNNAVREIFLNCFVHVFHSYETFVIQPSQDMDSWLTNRETMCNFEKAAFLSDQPEAYLPFLSPFTETQMFATLIDNKIISHWEESDPYVRVFDQRIKAMKDQSESRTPVYSKCTTIKDTDTILVKRARFIDHVAPQPHLLEEMNITSLSYNGVFPLLNAEVMNTEPTSIKPKPRESAKWRRKDRLLQHSEHLELQPHQREKYMQEARSKGVRGPKISLMTAAEMLHTNWRFVETLLKEGKLKTKRMLVEKMGQEAVDLGHGEGNLTGVEENTLIASLCDLLERIWSHGLQTKKGKSALWSHLLGYQELQDISENSQPIDPHLLSPGNVAMPTTGCSLRKEEKRGSRLDLNSIVDLYFALCNISMPAITDGEKPGREKTHRRKGSSGRIELPILKPLSRSLVVDMRKVQNMTEIKTDVGFARAWVRLSLEKKILAKHFKELFANSDLLRKLYKRYAFLRCEEEREQFLYHLLSLNAVDYFCFTNSFTNTVMPYKILIFPSLKFGCSTTSANSWISIAGQLGETGTIEIPKGCLECNIEQKNLGVLTTLRIGHDNSGMTPRWLVEYILVRNELSGHTYNFPCGRWLGKNVDDGSTERLLVAELLSQNTVEDIALVSRTPPRCHSPSSPRKNNEQSSKLPEIQEMLGQSVNNLVKYFYKPEKERGNLTFLLCGERGLVQCLELVFQYGFRSARLFRNKFFIWDYLEKVKSHYENLLDSDPNHPISRSIEAKHFCILLHKINNATETIGKDGKFQIFTCIGVRDHCLQKWLPLIANTVITGQMYEENSFLRDPSLLTFLVHILRTLDEFPIVLEASLTQGIEI